MKITTVALIGKHDLQEHKEFVNSVFTFLQKKKLTILCDENIAKVTDQSSIPNNKILKQADLAVVMGGDGTLLRTARSLGQKKVLCYSINLGTLGFLTESEPDKALKGLSQILKNKYVLDKRFLLRVSVYREGKKVKTDLVLNDAVIGQGPKARLIQLKVETNQRLINRFQADGVIFATPTGSTGHSLSAGGPIIHPKLDAFVITPICPVSLSNRPIAMPTNRQLNVTVETVRERHECVSLTLDGQETFDLQYADEVKIRKSSRYFHLVRLTDGNYYKSLRTKLNWGE